MSKSSQELNEKNKQFLTVNDPTIKNSTSSIVRSGYETPESIRSWKKFERGKTECVETPDDKEPENADSQLKRSTSFPSRPEKSSKNKESQLRYPFQEEAAGQSSPVLYQSKSSLWSVTSDTSSVINNKNGEKPSTVIKSNENRLSVLSDHDETQKSDKCSPASNKISNSVSADDMVRSQQASPQSVKCQQPTYITINSEKVNSKDKRKKGLTFSVQEMKAKTDRDPELINQDLKVNFQDIIAEPQGFYTPQFSWSLSREVFSFARSCFYTVVSFLCAIPFACFWGIWFSILTCCNVWCLMPFKRSHIISIAYWKFCWGALVSCFCDPLCKSLGMTLSNISMRTEKHIV